MKDEWKNDLKLKLIAFVKDLTRDITKDYVQSELQ